MSYLADILVAGDPLIISENLPVVLKYVEGTDGHKQVISGLSKLTKTSGLKVNHPVTRSGHVLVNYHGRPIGYHKGIRERGIGHYADSDIVQTDRSCLSITATTEQVLSINTYALMQLMPFHPSSLIALKTRSPDKWKNVGDRIEGIDIPLIYPHLLPKNVNGSGMETESGLKGYGKFDTDPTTSAGQLAYAEMIERVLAKVDEFVMQPNGFKNHENPFVAYMRAGGMYKAT